MPEFFFLVSFHGDADDVVARTEATDEPTASDKVFAWFDEDHDGPAVLEVARVFPDLAPADLLEVATEVR